MREKLRGMKARTVRWLTGTDERDLLQLPESKHREKLAELERRRADLWDRRTDLTEEKHVSEAKVSKLSSNDYPVEAEKQRQVLEDIEQELRIVNLKLEKVNELSELLAKIIAIYELKNLFEDEYWQRLERLDNRSIIRDFTESRKEFEEREDSVEKLEIVSEDVLNTIGLSESEN